jgi:hypothetical protein
MDGQGKPRFESYIKKHLLHLSNNLYISPNDPLYYEKVLQYINPRSSEAHYHMGQKCEKSGRISKAIYHYSEAAKEYGPYYYDSIKALQRFEDVSPSPQGDAVIQKRGYWKRTLLITLLLFNLVLLMLLFTMKPSVSVATPPGYGNPQHVTAGPASEFRPIATGPEQLEPTTYVGVNLVRTALQTYIEEQGHPPGAISQLLFDYPDNYLSFIPLEGISGHNLVSDHYTGEGGWVYNSRALLIAEMFYPNVESAVIPFHPVAIFISKEDYSMSVSVGDQLLFKKEVGLGRANQTPEGTYTVLDRVKDPQGVRPNVFGAAALGMGDIAIHGTDVTQSIGANLSLGCIRLRNEDVMEIFPFIPKGTKASIAAESSHNQLLLGSTTFEFPHSLLPASTQQQKETADGMIFHWLN